MHPRTLFSMFDEKRKIDKSKMRVQAYYIYCFMNGQEPEDNELPNNYDPLDSPGNDGIGVL